jgi:hypothetical protein
VHTIIQQKVRPAYKDQARPITEGTFDMQKRGSIPLPAPVCLFDAKGEASRHVP